MQINFKNFVYLILLFPFLCMGQNEIRKYYSSEADLKYPPCLDTIRVGFLYQVHDIGPAIPSWIPVDSARPTLALEGTVYLPDGLHKDSHVSSDDLPFVHYTHDYTFNLKVDSAYQKYMAYRLFPLDGGRYDTVRQKYVHIEWESGLCAGNSRNLCAEANRRGESCGFFSAGHTRQARIWNWPVPHDWVHVEGKWVWDRGHPPAYMELHPARAIFIQRNLPAKVKTPEGTKRFATRVDCFLSGDGGALVNNLPNVPGFVERARMSEKDYSTKVKHTLPRPSPNAKLKYFIETQRGDNFPAQADIVINETKAEAEITVRWKGSAPDNAIFARTIYFYWDEGNGVAQEYDIFSYKVTLDKLKILRPLEWGRSEFRVFLEVGGEWICLNEFIDVADILNDGLGKTFKRNWDINQSFIVHVPRGKYFRVHAGGWEADGLETTMGVLADPNMPCTPENKIALNDILFDVNPVGLHGCYDDKIDEVHDFHTPELLKQGGTFEGIGFGTPFQDPCPLGSNNNKPILRLYYHIEPYQE